MTLKKLLFLLLKYIPSHFIPGLINKDENGTRAIQHNTNQYMGTVYGTYF